MKYIVNKSTQSTGEHEVHNIDCNYLPIPSNRVDLGEHTTCASAVKKAISMGYKADGCYHCCDYCHTR